MKTRSFVAGTTALILGASGVALAGDTHTTSSAPGEATQGQPAPSKAAQSNAAQSNAASSSAASSAPSQQQTMELQRALASRNFYSGPVDGIWGPKTASALRNFQVQNELGATGQLDDATASALGMTMERQNVSGKEPGSQGATVGGNSVGGSSIGGSSSGGSGVAGAQSQQAQSATPGASARSSTQIRLDTLSQQQAQQLQQRLQSLGFYQGAIDGQLGAGTRAALQRYFQQQANLAQQGVLSDSTIGIFGAQPGELQPVSGQEGGADMDSSMSPHGPSMNRQQPGASPSGSSPTQGAPRMDGTQGNSGSRGASSPGAQGSSSSGSQPSPGAQGSSSGSQGSSGSGAQGGGTTP